MARYENGAETREKIIDACQKLFFEKGFTQTTYLDICKEAHVNQGSIYYHFKEKAELFRVVDQRENQKNRAFARRLLPKDAPAYMEWMIDIYVYWHRFFCDPQYRRFMSTPGSSPFSDLDEYYYYWHHLSAFIPDYDVFFREHVLDFTICTGIDRHLGMYAMENLDAYTPNELTEYELRVFMSIFQIERERIDRILERVRTVIGNVDFSCLLR